MKNINKKVLALSLIINILIILNVAMADIPLQKLILKSTVYIKNEYGNVGTGFLMSKQVGEEKQGVFLITNRHILRKDGKGAYSKYINVRFYKRDTKESEQKTEWIPITILQDNNTFAEIIFMHKEEDVDIVGILINGLVNQFSDKIDFTHLEDDWILTREIAQKEYIDAGEDLFILGYTAGVFSETNYLPLVKPGLLSSSSSEDLFVRLGNRIIKGKIYLVDGSLFGGNSGGPVFIKPRWKVTRDKDGRKQIIHLDESIPSYLLGVQSSSIHFTEKIYIRIIGLEEATPLEAGKNVVRKLEKDKEGEYIPIDKEIMLNIVFSSEYLNDIFDSYIRLLNKVSSTNP